MIMKKYVLFLVVSTFFASIFAEKSPVLMKINGKEISKSEFEYIYNKNNSQNIVDKKDLNEYVQLFVDLKLKVSEAETQGLDTTKTFKEEFNGYRDRKSVV